MEYLIGVLVALLGGIFYYKKKADDAIVDSKLAETKGKDEVLKQRQEELKSAIKEIDDNIKKMNENREVEKKKNDNLTLAELRDKIRKGQR